MSALLRTSVSPRLRIAFPSAPPNHHGNAGYVALPKPSAAADPLGKMDEKWMKDDSTTETLLDQCAPLFSQ